MAKVYLETSFFSACVSTRTGAKSAGWRASSLEWWEKWSQNYELFISGEVIKELSAEEYRNSEKALAMLVDIDILHITEEVVDVANLFVSEKVMPGPAVEGDALHVAVAAFYRMDYLLTWNVKHLANPAKRVHLSVVCSRIGLLPPQLVIPEFLQGSES